MQRLEENDIQTRPVWVPNHSQKPYKKCQFYRIERASKLAKKSLCLPSSVGIDSEDLQKVINTILS